MTKLGAFTLVELVVVITILAILGTIGFLALQGKAGNARDSARISDLRTVQSGLANYSVSAGSYPTPDNAVALTYSG